MANAAMIFNAATTANLDFVAPAPLKHATC